MSDFYRRAIKKLDKLTAEQCRELLISAADEMGRLEMVLNSITTGILVCDEEHRLLMVNRAARWLLSIHHGEGKPLWNTILDERAVKFFQEILLSGDRVTDREIDVEVQGQNRLFSVSVLPLVRERRINGSLICIEDITERRNRELRLHRVESLASLTTLAAGVAHEIKNPLGSISIHLQLMQKTLAKGEVLPGRHKDHINETLTNYINVLNEEVDRLNRIVVDFLFAVRPMALELRERNINTLITELAEFVGPEMEQSDILLLLELDDALPAVLIDERLMKQVLLNLMKNAQAAMPTGGVLTMATRCFEDEIWISVCDTGVGISEENLRKIFEPYFTTKETGTGLGLTLVYKIIREHHGEISVDSREGEGTNIEINLPIPQREQRLIGHNTEQSFSTGAKQ